MLCPDPNPPALVEEGGGSLFERWWKLNLTVPIFLALLAFPLLNFQSPTIFSKFNGLGTISVTYLCIFVVIKARECGFHMDFTLPASDPNHIARFQFPVPFLRHLE